MNRCRPAKKGTNEHGKMLKIILMLEKGEVPDRYAREWKIEGENRRATRKECKRPRQEIEVGGFMAQIVQHRQKEDAGRQRSATQRRGRLNQIIQGLTRGELFQKLVEGGHRKQGRRSGGNKQEG